MSGDATPDADDGPTPLPAIRKHCVACCSGSPHEVRLCVSTSCPLWAFRFGRRPTEDERAAIDPAKKVHPFETGDTRADVSGLSPLKMIRRRCLDCSGDSAPEVAECTRTRCALWPLRFGKPARKREYTDEQRAALVARLRPSNPKDGQS